MMDNGVDLQNAHLSQLAGWVLNTIGKAVALSIGVAFGIGVIAALFQEPIVLWLGGLLAPLTFAAVLYNASPPFAD